MNEAKKNAEDLVKHFKETTSEVLKKVTDPEKRKRVETIRDMAIRDVRKAVSDK